MRSEIEFPKEYENKYKVCSECGNEKQYKEFYFKEYINKDNEHTYTFNARCIECDIKAVEIARMKNSQWIKDYNHNRNKKKTKYYRLLHRKYKRDDPEHYTEWGKNWRKENTEKIKGYSKKYKLHKKHDISKKELDELYEYAKYSCMYCGMTESESKIVFGERLHKDHAINSGSNKIDNCILACRNCNISKRDNDWDIWYIPDNEKYNEERYQKIKNWLNKFII